MTNCMSYGWSFALAGVFGLLTAGGDAQAPPGFSSLDKTNPAATARHRPQGHPNPAGRNATGEAPDR